MKLFGLPPFVVTVESEHGQDETDRLSRVDLLSFIKNGSHYNTNSLENVDDGVIDCRDETQDLERHETLDEMGHSVND